MTTIIINTNIKRNCVIVSTKLQKFSDHCIDCWIRMQALVTIFMFEYVIVRVVIFVLTVGRLCSHGMEYQWVNGRCDINDFGTLPLFFSTSKYFRWKFQTCPSFYSHPNIPHRFIGVKMHIILFSFLISLQSRRKKGTNWILSNISHRKWGEIFGELLFQTLAAFFPITGCLSQKL